MVMQAPHSVQKHAKCDQEAHDQKICFFSFHLVSTHAKVREKNSAAVNTRNIVSNPIPCAGTRNRSRAANAAAIRIVRKKFCPILLLTANFAIMKATISIAKMIPSSTNVPILTVGLIQASINKAVMKDPKTILTKCVDGFITRSIPNTIQN